MEKTKKLTRKETEKRIHKAKKLAAKIEAVADPKYASQVTQAEIDIVLGSASRLVRNLEQMQRLLNLDAHATKVAILTARDVKLRKILGDDEMGPGEKLDAIIRLTGRVEVKTAPLPMERKKKTSNGATATA